jgi:hypothetical protein
MDPVANLNEQLENARHILANEDDFTDLEFRLAELIVALDEWRRSGGFDPYTAQSAS